MIQRSGERRRPNLCVLVRFRSPSGIVRSRGWVGANVQLCTYTVPPPPISAVDVAEVNFRASVTTPRAGVPELAKWRRSTPGPEAQHPADLRSAANREVEPLQREVETIMQYLLSFRSEAKLCESWVPEGVQVKALNGRCLQAWPRRALQVIRPEKRQCARLSA